MAGDAMTDTQAASPNAAGPAGARLEAGVAAHYLLALLRGEDARGLPGVRLTRVKLQRAAADHPLDDVIVEGQNAGGATVYLDIQVKRQVQFSPGDAVFRKIMGQVADTLRLGEAAQVNRDLAIATSQTTRKIDGPYQDVLTWARAISEPSVFFDRIRQAGSASEDHRRFVNTVTAHLKDEGVDHDDRAVLALLRRLQILVFDLERDGSVQQALTHEQCLAALAPEAAGQAASLQAVLENLALEIAAEGGDVTRPQLLDRPTLYGFQFAGERRYARARATLAETSTQVLAEIDDRLGEIVLLRPEAMEKVNEALDQGRYIEIRGAGGVGKSSVLKHLAQTLGVQGRMIALSPERTEVGGWARFRNTLEFPGSAKDLLVDLSAAGGGMLLVDGLDNFEPPAQALVRDLVDAAAQVPGFQVVVTARLAFGVDNENWIPLSARRALGIASAVRLVELSGEEIDQLRQAAPTLAPLLADGHPAQAVARNLYRLRRLLAQGAEASEVRTEVDLADLWWRTGDAPDGPARRPRTRILQDVADQLLVGATRLDTSSFDPTPLDALVRSETLRDLGGEQMVLRHDILRDWALFGRLRERPAALTNADLAQAPTPSLLRAVELLARYRLEHGDLDAWRRLLERVSAPGRHAAWRRAVLLALVRSEAAAAILDLAAPDLLAEDGRLLQDLIRLTLAVEAQTLAELVAQTGQTATEAMARIAVPSGPSWNRLTVWLLTLGDRLASKATPDVVTLWARWLQFTSGRGRSSAAIVRRFHAWLAQAMDDKEAKAKDTLSGFGDGFDKGLYAGVVETLRGHVVAFALAAPDLAAPYVERLRTLRYESEAADDAVLGPGELSTAAPQALAALTFERLAADRPGIRHSRRDRWSFLDGQFIAESPSRGPFLALLRAHPAIGLALVRRMVEHAVAPGLATPSIAPFLEADDDDDADLFLEDRGASEDTETLSLAFDAGERVVTHLDYYELSRPVGSNGYAAASSLMALEAWAQDRLDKKELLATVLADVLGDGPIPAPFLLVAVDLLLSHWNDEAMDLALPLVGNPHLLTRDFSRQTHDSTRYGALSRGLGKPEPGTAPFTLDDLGQRPSRQNTLSGVVWLYARGEETRRQKLQTLIETAAVELPPKSAYYGWGDPTFMAERMLHMLEPANWSSDVHPETGAPVIVYAAPADPVLQARADAAMDNVRMMNAQNALARAVESTDPTPQAQLAFALAIAQGEQAASRYDTSAPAGAEDEAQTKAAAALVLARDLSAETWPNAADWVRARVVEGLATEERMGGSLRYDVAGMAFVTLVHMLQRDRNEHDLTALLTAAASPRHKAYAGFKTTFDMVEALDPRLSESVLRCALTTRVSSWLPWNASEAFIASEKAARTGRGQRAVEAELIWLREGGEPPPWPEFPLQRPTPRQGLKLPTASSASALAGALGIAPVAAADDLKPESIQPEQEDEDDGVVAVPTVEDGAAAEWLELVPPDGATPRPWRLDLVRAYADWTYVKNGAGLGRHVTLNGNFRSWNEAFFYQLGLATPHMTAQDLAELIFEPLTSLPDKQRLAAATPLLLAIDAVFFNDRAISADQAVAWRDEIAERVRETSGWEDLRGKESGRIEVTLGPAVSTVFFARRHTAGSYLKPPAADRLDPFLPTLSRLVADCPNLSVAAAFLSVLEVKTRGAFAAPLLDAVQVWLTAFPHSARFWREADVGRRACALFEAIRAAEPGALVSLGQDLDGVLGELVALGITEAGLLERGLSELRAQAGSRG